MKIAIMGSGAVGAYVGAHLQAASADVTFIARGAHLQAMQRHGLQILMPGKDLLLPSVKATSDPSTLGNLDVVVFAVKLTDTVSAAQSLRSVVGAQTRVLTLQNGIDSVDMITKELPQAQVRGGMNYLSAVIDKPLELPWLSGRMHQLGQQLGVPTPAHTAVYRGLVLKVGGST